VENVQSRTYDFILGVREDTNGDKCHDKLQGTIYYAIDGDKVRLGQSKITSEIKTDLLRWT
jgi:hypothetical protein